MAASGAQDQLIQMCFGGGERELNLAAVRARARAQKREATRLCRRGAASLLHAPFWQAHHPPTATAAISVRRW